MTKLKRITLVLELVQIPRPTRQARIEDFLVDAFGVSLGIAGASSPN
jgi:hypothetical protein